MLLRLILLCLLAAPLWATEQPIYGSTQGNNLNASAVRYLSIGTATAPATTDAARSAIVAAPGNITKLRVQLGAAPGVGTSYAFALMKNNVAQSLTCTISGASDTTCSDTSNTVAVVAGDLLSLRATPSTTPTATTAAYSIYFTSTNAGETLILSGGSTNVPDTASTYYQYISGQNTWDATETNRVIVVPTGGTIRDMYVDTITAPGASKSYDFTLVQNGTPTTLTCQVTGAASTTCNDTAHDITVTAGDIFSVSAAPTGTPTAGTPRIGFVFAPTTDGESLLLTGTTGAPSTSATRYNAISTPAVAYNSSESVSLQLAGEAVTLRKFYARVATAPGDTKTWTWRIRNAGGNGNQTCAITGAATTTCSDSSNTDSIAQFAVFNISIAPTGTPTASGVTTWGVVAYVAPASTGPPAAILVSPVIQ